MGTKLDISGLYQGVLGENYQRKKGMLSML